jgi:hypothetical protein
LADVLFGAPYCDGAASNAGAAYLVLGTASPTGGSLVSHLTLEGEAADDYAGGSVAGAGDVDGDGLGDFLIAASNNGDAGGGAGHTR